MRGGRSLRYKRKPLAISRRKGLCRACSPTRFAGAPSRREPPLYPRKQFDKSKFERSLLRATGKEKAEIALAAVVFKLAAFFAREQITMHSCQSNSRALRDSSHGRNLVIFVVILVDEIKHHTLFRFVLSSHNAPRNNLFPYVEGLKFSISKRFVSLFSKSKR